MKRRLCVSLCLGIIGTMVLPLIAMASYVWYIDITVTETSGLSYTNLPLIAPANNVYYGGHGYITPYWQNTAVYGPDGTNLPRMLTDNNTLFVAPSVPANSSQNFRYSMSDTDNTSFDIIAGYGGYVTTSANASLNLGDNFSVTTQGYIPTSSINATLVRNGAVGGITTTENVTYEETITQGGTPGLQLFNCWDAYGGWWKGVDAYAIVGYSAGSYNRAGTFMRWFATGGGGIGIPKDATITSAYVTFTAATNQSGTPVNSTFIGHKGSTEIGSLSDYVTYLGLDYSTGIFSGEVTTATVPWDGIGSWTTGNEYNSPDLTTIIQELVNQSSWDETRDIELIWEDHPWATTTNGAREAKNGTIGNTPGPTLHIEYNSTETTSGFNFRTYVSGASEVTSELGGTSVTATGVSPTDTITTVLSGGTLGIYDNGTIKDSTSFSGSANTTDNWTWMEGIPYLNYAEITIDGTPTLYYTPNQPISGTVLPDMIGGNPGEFHWGTNPVSVTANVLSSSVPANAPMGDNGWKLIPTVPTSPEGLFSEGGTGFPGGPQLAALGVATGNPPTTFLFLLAFILAILAGFAVYAATQNTKYGQRGSLFLQALTSLMVMVGFYVGGGHVIPGWTLIPFGLESLLMLMWRNPNNPST